MAKEININLNEINENQDIKIINSWNNMVEPYLQLSKLIYTRDYQECLNYIKTNEFKNKIKKNRIKNQKDTFDNLKKLLFQLYDDDLNYLSERFERLDISTYDTFQGKIILNPLWKPFIIFLKKIIDFVDSYRYDNEIQFAYY